MLSLTALAPHSWSGRSASRSFAPLGSTKLGTAMLASAWLGSAWLGAATDGSAADAGACDGWFPAAADGLDAVEEPQAQRLATSAPVARAPTIRRVPISISLAARTSPSPVIPAESLLPAAGSFVSLHTSVGALALERANRVAGTETQGDVDVDGGRDTLVQRAVGLLADRGQDPLADRVRRDRGAAADELVGHAGAGTFPIVVEA